MQCCQNFDCHTKKLIYRTWNKRPINVLKDETAFLFKASYVSRNSWKWKQEQIIIFSPKAIERKVKSSVRVYLTNRFTPHAIANEIGRLCVPITHFDPGLSLKRAGFHRFSCCQINSVFLLLVFCRNPLWRFYISENFKIIATNLAQRDWIRYDFATIK